MSLGSVPDQGSVFVASMTNPGQAGEIPLPLYKGDEPSINPVKPVPEPSSFALLGLGGVGLAIRAIHRRRW